MLGDNAEGDLEFDPDSLLVEAALPVLEDLPNQFRQAKD